MRSETSVPDLTGIPVGVCHVLVTAAVANLRHHYPGSYMQYLGEPKVIFTAVLKACTSSLIAAYNPPSGNLTTNRAGIHFYYLCPEQPLQAEFELPQDF